MGEEVSGLRSLCPHCGALHPSEVLKCPKTDIVLPLAGRLLDGKFRLSKELGRGGMAEVWKAINIAVDREVAIKLIQPGVARRSETVGRFRSEARAAGRLMHPNICEILDSGSSPVGPYIVMQYLRGESLASVLRRRVRLPVEVATGIMSEALEGLAAAHQAGIVHRDLKPENVFLHVPEVGPPGVRIMDFGISKLMDGSGEVETEHGALLGTPEYMSPEQFAGASLADERADLWAVGVILYRSLTGRSPFSGPTVAATLLEVSSGTPVPLREHRPELPQALEEVVMRCLAKNREHRPPDAKALREALAPFVGEVDLAAIADPWRADKEARAGATTGAADDPDSIGPTKQVDLPPAVRKREAGLVPEARDEAEESEEPGIAPLPAPVIRRARPDTAAPLRTADVDAPPLADASPDEGELASALPATDDDAEREGSESADADPAGDAAGAALDDDADDDGLAAAAPPSLAAVVPEDTDDFDTTVQPAPRRGSTQWALLALLGFAVVLGGWWMLQGGVGSPDDGAVARAPADAADPKRPGGAGEDKGGSPAVDEGPDAAAPDDAGMDDAAPDDAAPDDAAPDDAALDDAAPDDAAMDDAGGDADEIVVEGDAGAAADDAADAVATGGAAEADADAGAEAEADAGGDDAPADAGDDAAAADEAGDAGDAGGSTVKPTSEPDPPGTVRFGVWITLAKPGTSGNQGEARKYCRNLARNGYLGVTNWELAGSAVARRLEGNRSVRRGRYWTAARWKNQAYAINLPKGTTQKLPANSKQLRPLCVAKRPRTAG